MVGSAVLIDAAVMDTLESGCRNKPNASDGETVKLRQALFATEVSTSISTASASKTATATFTTLSTASTSKTSPTASTQPDKPPQTEPPALSTGAAAGIGVGAGAGGLILIAALVWVFFLRKRRGQTSESYKPPAWNESTSHLKSGPQLTEMPVPNSVNRQELEGFSRAELPGS